MADLGGGGTRASNGGAARGGGPVPVPSTASPGVKTPRDVMKERIAREARRQEEQRLAEERRRLSAERRAMGQSEYGRARTQPAVPQYDSPGPSSSAVPGASQRLSGSGQVASGTVLGEPVGRMDYAQASSSRARGSSVSQADQPRPAPAPAPTLPTIGIRRSHPQAPQPTQRTQPQPSAQAGASSSADLPDRLPTQSSFPHAFERWERLSSHWEGLTSYWLHKLEANQAELASSIPSASAMSRQITDLSAAGANLFHAVVELQRLRASSERKFQRWFFETRAESERGLETRAELQRLLDAERRASGEAELRAQTTGRGFDVLRREMAISRDEARRELAISKDEARRAWEELGRREQEDSLRAVSLREGRTTFVGGVQVRPTLGGGDSEVDSPSQASAQAAGQQRPFYTQNERASPTDTDPFTEPRAPQPQSLARGSYQPAPAPPSPTPPPNSAAFYHQPPAPETFLHSPPLPSPPHPDSDATSSGGDAALEYAIAPSGDYERDSQGRLVPLLLLRDPPVVRSRPPPAVSSTETSGEAAEAGTMGGGSWGAARMEPVSSNAAMAVYGSELGTGYGDGTATATAAGGGVRHHHPTRLSDVLEEEEGGSRGRMGE